MQRIYKLKMQLQCESIDGKTKYQILGNKHKQDTDYVADS